jgi:hypothetical protein
MAGIGYACQSRDAIQTAPGVQQRPAQIPEQIERLEKAINHLFNCSESLGTRLSPYMRTGAQGLQTKSEKATPELMAPVARAVADYTDRIYTIVSSLEDILNQLEV